MIKEEKDEKIKDANFIETNKKSAKFNDAKFNDAKYLATYFIDANYFEIKINHHLILLLYLIINYIMY